MGLNNTTYTHEEKFMFAGNFPVVTIEVECKEAIAQGEVIGYNSSFEFGKYGDTYTNIYGVAHKASGKKTGETKEYCEVFLTGEFFSKFVIIPSGKENEIKFKLKNINIFLK